MSGVYPARSVATEEDEVEKGNQSPFPGTNKSEFPSTWSDKRILNEISDITTDSKQKWSAPDPKNGYITTSKTVDGINIKVVYDPVQGRVVTAYPTNVPRNP